MLSGRIAFKNDLYYFFEHYQCKYNANLSSRPGKRLNTVFDVL